MSIGLLLIVIVVGGYLAAHFASEWLARRFLIVSGAEYLLLGVLLGPGVSGVLDPSAVDGFAPFLTLAFGWIGALVGAQFQLRELIRIPGKHFTIAFIEASLVLVFTAGVMAAASVWWFELGWRDVLIPAIALGAIAVSSAPTGIAVVSRRFGTRGPLVPQLLVTQSVDSLFSIVAFGILLAITHSAPPGGVRPPTPTEWMAITLAIGLGAGVLFHLFVGGERKIDRLFIALAGALILTSGAAAYLRLSPLLPALLVGFVLVNTSPAGGEIRQVLSRVERPLYFVLLIFAGAAWSGSVSDWAIIAPLFVVVRILAKVGCAGLAARIEGALPALGHRWGWGLIGQGGLAIAVALNYRLYDDSILAGVAFTAALASVLATDFLSARLVQALVVASDEGPPPAEGDLTELGAIR